MWTDTGVGRLFAGAAYGGTGERNLNVWATGRAADAFDRMESEAVLARLRADIGRIRPATAGEFDLGRIVSWQQDPFSRGAYFHWVPAR